MDSKQYIKLTGKTEVKSKPKNRPLSKAKQNYLEAQETLNQELKEIICINKCQFAYTTIYCLLRRWRAQYN
ncbi:hypothetical protein [Acinetobacter calcoaceticus]|uniref:hypothetical protein n=1 Tax=Acinetobacter calcoaceticus TaxID=471 RepID=UPI001E5DFD71|nr:hypothetical protein [Acinetobacter calcoaceticus]UGQ31753.1 hypothetical protein LRO84_05535 [Acinetobacter calcoaceticus]